MRRNMHNRLIYTWDYPHSNGIQFWPGWIELYRAPRDDMVGVDYVLMIWRLSVSWWRVK
jgi:hypothetical protein